MTTEFGEAYADERIRRRTSPARRLVKSRHLDTLARCSRGAAIIGRDPAHLPESGKLRGRECLILSTTGDKRISSDRTHRPFGTKDYTRDHCLTILAAFRIEAVDWRSSHACILSWRR